MKSLFTLIILSANLASCSTIYFMSDSKNDETEASEWHHDWIYGLIEGSNAVDMKNRCKGSDWQVIKTEETFLQGLMASATLKVYTPYGLEYSCRAPKK